MPLYGPTVPIEAEAGGVFQGKAYEASFQGEKTNKPELNCLETPEASGEDFGASKNVFLILELGPICNIPTGSLLAYKEMNYTS